MKKLIAVLLAAVVAPCAFAQVYELNASAKTQANTFQRALTQSAARSAVRSHERVTDLQKKLETTLLHFAQVMYTQKYSDYGYIFQALDNVRLSYLALRNASVEAARTMAPRLNEPIQIDNGARTIRIADYVRMESCVLGSVSSREMILWENWSRLLEEDLAPAQSPALAPLPASFPADFARGVQNFRRYVSQAKELNPQYVLQSMMGAMDAFNAAVKKKPQLGPSLAKEFVKPLQAGWGSKIEPVSFIKDHACELYGPVQQDLELFAEKLEQLSR